MHSKRMPKDKRFFESLDDAFDYAMRYIDRHYPKDILDNLSDTDRSRAIDRMFTITSADDRHPLDKMFKTGTMSLEKSKIILNSGRPRRVRTRKRKVDQQIVIGRDNECTDCAISDGDTRCLDIQERQGEMGEHAISAI